MVVVADTALDAAQPPDLFPLPTASDRRGVRPNPYGYPVAWIRGRGTRRDGSPFTFVDLSWPDRHRGEKLTTTGRVSGTWTFTPVQVDLAIYRRALEVRATLARAGGPLAGLVDPHGHLIAPMADAQFDAATAELLLRHQAGEWVGQTISTMFYAHLAGFICGRSLDDLIPMMTRLHDAGLARRLDMVLLPPGE